MAEEKASAAAVNDINDIAHSQAAWKTIVIKNTSDHEIMICALDRQSAVTEQTIKNLADYQSKNSWGIGLTGGADGVTGGASFNKSDEKKKHIENAESLKLIIGTFKEGGWNTLAPKQELHLAIQGGVAYIKLMTQNADGKYNDKLTRDMQTKDNFFVWDGDAFDTKSFAREKRLAFQIIAVHSGKAIDGRATMAEDGIDNWYQFEKKSDFLFQQFYFLYDKDAEENKTSFRIQNVQSQKFLFGEAVRWYLNYTNSIGVYTIEKVGDNGNCLNVSGASKEDAAELIIYPAEGGDNEKFHIRLVPTIV